MSDLQSVGEAEARRVLPLAQGGTVVHGEHWGLPGLEAWRAPLSPSHSTTLRLSSPTRGRSLAGSLCLWVPVDRMLVLPGICYVTLTRFPRPSAPPGHMSPVTHSVLCPCVPRHSVKQEVGPGHSQNSLSFVVPRCDPLSHPALSVPGVLLRVALTPCSSKNSVLADYHRVSGDLSRPVVRVGGGARLSVDQEGGEGKQFGLSAHFGGRIGSLRWRQQL